MSDEVYALGRDHESRGPKGVTIDNSGRVLTVTFEKRPIAFFDLAGTLVQAPIASNQRRALRARGIRRRQYRLDEVATKLMGSRSFRLTKPFRMLNSWVEVVAALTQGCRHATPPVSMSYFGGRRLHVPRVPEPGVAVAFRCRNGELSGAWRPGGEITARCIGSAEQSL